MPVKQLLFFSISQNGQLVYPCLMHPRQIPILEYSCIDFDISKPPAKINRLNAVRIPVKKCFPQILLVVYFKRIFFTFFFFFYSILALRNYFIDRN